MEQGHQAGKAQVEAVAAQAASRRLAEYAVGLTYDRIPPEVVERAKDCVIDTVGACVFGSQLPWTQTVIEYSRRNSAPGECSVFGTLVKVRAPFACLSNGASVHAFELDCLCEPSVGIHPSAALAVPGLAPAQGRKMSGKALLSAIVAGYEVLYRIGDSAKHSIEKNGFHSPGVVGPFGTAIVIGRMFSIDAKQMANALGIAGSTSAGLMEFSRTGGMVKRLHLGRAAEAGFMAAVLARDGYTGPEGVLDGKFGFLNVFCNGGDTARLTKDLGSVWHVMKTKIKRYSCHSTAQVPVTLALDLMEKHRISGDDVAGIAIAAGEKTVTQHAINEPRDLTMMQYSVPFCVATALYKDPLDPRVFSEATLNDPKIRALCKSAQVELLKSSPGYQSSACRLTLTMKNGKALTAEGHDFKGTPTMPLTREELRDKFLKLTAHRDRAKAERLFSQLAEAEKVKDFSTLDFAL
ncbi:MAG: MmgE/PrpD family protein [Betaproteobacteria bacterium]|nr:MmgE/PrpD family protein [Betaproteobacteria bacterium]